jgi:hypothetical protein
MNVWIRAVNKDDDDGPYGKKGKDFPVHTADYEVTATGEDILIRARTETKHGDGSRNGLSKTIVHYRVVNLKPDDLRRILVEALNGKLVSLPGMTEIEKARLEIEKVERAMENVMRGLRLFEQGLVELKKVHSA